MARSRFLVGDQLVGYIRTRSAQLQLDPNATVAVGSAEGGFRGRVGDHGTSFGPYQLHQGGELPPGLSGRAARLWANSKAGIDYALQRMAAFARGLKGSQAVDAIVTDFEKPADGGVGDRQRAAAYMRANRRGGQQIRWTGVSVQGVKPALLADVAAAVAEVGGTGVQVTSGKRAPGPGNDVKNSNHITGDALDGYVLFPGGARVALGSALKPVASKYGLRSGDVAGFDPAKPGGYDPVHVDDGANAGGVTATGGPTVVRTRPETQGGGGGGGGPLSWLGSLPGSPASLGELAFGSLFGGGIGGLTDVFKGLIWLMNPRSWLRMVEFLTGTLLMLFGLVGLAVVFLQRSEGVGKAATVAAALPGPVGIAGKAVTTVRRPAAAARSSQVRRRREQTNTERTQRTQARLADRRERDEQDLYYRANRDELDERRREREHRRNEKTQQLRDRLAKARRDTEEVPF